jgi:hypothetical protein
MPTVTELPGSTPERRIYLLEGGDLAPEWAKKVRPTEEAWCRIVVYGNAIGVYGGEVWPAAWPDLFTADPSNQRYHGGAGMIVTPLGMILLAGARVA